MESKGIQVVHSLYLPVEQKGVRGREVWSRREEFQPFQYRFKRLEQISPGRQNNKWSLSCRRNEPQILGTWLSLLIKGIMKVWQVLYLLKIRGVVKWQTPAEEIWNVWNYSCVDHLCGHQHDCKVFCWFFSPVCLFQRMRQLHPKLVSGCHWGHEVRLEKLRMKHLVSFSFPSAWYSLTCCTEKLLISFENYYLFEQLIMSVWRVLLFFLFFF